MEPIVARQFPQFATKLCTGISGETRPARSHQSCFAVTISRGRYAVRQRVADIAALPRRRAASPCPSRGNAGGENFALADRARGVGS